MYIHNVVSLASIILIIVSLIPRPFPAPALDRLQYAKTAQASNFIILMYGCATKKSDLRSVLATRTLNSCPICWKVTVQDYDYCEPHLGTQSVLPHAGNKMLQGENRKLKRLAVVGSRTQDTSGLTHQCSACEPWQPDNHQPSQSSTCTAQVVLNASVTHPAATQYPSMHIATKKKTSLDCTRPVVAINESASSHGVVWQEEEATYTVPVKLLRLTRLVWYGE